MTDQKIEDIRRSLDGLADAQVRRVEVGMLRYLLTELDRLKAELAAKDLLLTDAHETRDATLQELATLKASGTFSDGLEAAAKEFAHLTSGQSVSGPAIVERIRALSPQPRPDAQAQRERELALVKSACDYVIRFYTAKDWSGPFLGYSDILEAFDRSHHD